MANQQDFWIKHRLKIVLSIIWIITIILLFLILKNLPIEFAKYSAILSGIVVIIAIGISFYLTLEWTTKKKCGTAAILSLIPIFPANRIYTDTFKMDVGGIVRFIPVIGNIWDLVTILIGQNKPKRGWDSKCF